MQSRSTRWTLYALVLAAPLLLPATSQAEFVLGVESQDPPPVPTGTPDTVAAPAGATIIDFDEMMQPCGFIETVAVREEYASLGVHFDAPGNDGGAILDECSNFGVTGQSSPNFLAFNAQAGLQDGGIPRTPQEISFDTPVSSVQFNMGTGFSPDLVTLTAYDAADQVVDTDSAVAASALQTLMVSGPGITRVQVDSAGPFLVIDDLAFVGGAPVPTLPAWALGVLILTLMGAAIIAAKLVR